MNKKLQKFFEGKKLYGDDFNLKKIKEWYKDEKEGYSSLTEDYYDGYAYHEINNFHGFSKLKNIKRFDKVLSFGGAKGEEINPLINKIDEITIIEPSKKLRVKKINGKKVKYIMPEISGKIKLKDNSFDLITCFGTLHHIPNVSCVFKELVRILKPRGFLLLREPIVSMGNWNKERKGLTKRERGIPKEVFEMLIKDNKLKIISSKKILFPLIRRIKFKNFKGGNSKFWIYLDYFLSILFYWNDKYHSTNIMHKLRPQSIFYVLQKK